MDGNAGTDDGGQRPILALAPHTSAVRKLKGSSRTAGQRDDNVCSLMRWEACWSCMPGLERLDWECFTSDLIDYEERAVGFGLPPSLRDFHLCIAWDTAYFSLSTLSALQYHTKVTTLNLGGPELLFQEVDWSLDLSLPDQQETQVVPEFPHLSCFFCYCSSLTGSLRAPNLAILTLTLQSKTEDVLNWADFACCQLLQGLVVHTDGILNCYRCSFPKTLEAMLLQLGGLEEDGCFRDLAAPGTKLSSMNASIGLSPRNNFDFTALTHGTIPSYLRVEQGITKLCMLAAHPI